MSTCTACATAIFLGCAFAKLEQTAQFVACAINTVLRQTQEDLRQTPNTRSVFESLKY